MSVKDLMNYIQLVDEHVISSTTDLKGRISAVSQAFCKISGYSEQELIGKNHNIVRHPDMPKSLYEHLWQTIKQGQAWSGEIKNLKKNGDHYWVKVHINPNLDPLGNMVGFTAVRQDITDHKKVEQLMHIDELTQLYNRRYYNKVLPNYIQTYHAEGLWIGYLMIDADHFKKYNDTYGHQAGDEVLRAIAHSLKTVFKDDHDQVFRLGGEEFCVLSCAQQAHQLRERADQAREHLLAKQIKHSGNAPFGFVTLSMGLMELEPNVQYVHDEIYKYADEALYRAKQNGRNQVEVVQSSVDDVELFITADSHH